MKLSEQTARILRVVEQRILEEPNRLDMGHWGTFWNPEFHRPGTPIYVMTSGGRRKQHIPECHTTACFAGHVLCGTKEGMEVLRKEGCIFPGVVNGKIVELIAFPPRTPFLAAEILGITQSQADRLFYMPKWSGRDGVGRVGWPLIYAMQYAQAANAEERAKVAVACIEDFIETGFEDK